MTSKRKKLARALSEKTGMSHQAAINVLAPPRPQAVARVERTVQQLLSTLQTPSTFGIVTGRCPAVGGSAVKARPH